MEQFEQAEQHGTRLEALLITQNGLANQAPLGIITVYDLALINSLV